MALRNAPKPAVNPAPSGAIGGQYQPLNPKELQDILDTAFRILAEIGMGETPPRLQELALAQGASLSADSKRVLFPRAMMEDIIDKSAKSFVFHGRDPKHDFEIGGDRVFFGTGGAAVQTLDLDSGLYRASTLQDLFNFARLVDGLDNISWFTRCCVATDVEDITDLDINTVYAMLRGTSKPLGTSFSIAETVDPIVDMFDIALGHEGAFIDRPFCKAHISPVISPLRYGEDAVAVTFKCIERRVPINAIIAAQSGATAPATPAGMLAHTTAETLAALAMVNLIEPGYPMIFSNWPFVIDLRSGAFSGSGGEISIMNAAAAQVSNALGLPSGVAASMADAKAIDAQLGSEKALSLLAAGLSGANMIYEAAGMTSSLLGVSFESFILDNETLSHVNRMIRGFEVNEDTLGFDAIQQAVSGEGHFLGAQHTMDAMERDYFYPPLANRESPRVWEEQGAQQIWTVANARAQAILSADGPEHLSASARNQIENRYKILL